MSMGDSSGRPTAPTKGYLVFLSFAVSAVLVGGTWLRNWFEQYERYRDALGGLTAGRALFAPNLSDSQLDDLVIYAHAARPGPWDESVNVVGAFARAGLSDVGTLRGLIDAAARDASLPYHQAACDLASSKLHTVHWEAKYGSCSR